MSYARFSSLDWQCDVYVYEDANGGWTTHVAARHWTWDVELPPAVTMSAETVEQWVDRHNTIMRLKKDEESGHWVGLPPADPDDPDESMFNDPTPGECAKRLRELRKRGFRVPIKAIHALEREQEALDKEKTDDN